MRRAVLQDLTCDSDGKINQYVDEQSIETSLPVHALHEGEDYLLGVFLVGAYQEILGDMHNLFGDTDSVNIYQRATAVCILPASRPTTPSRTCCVTCTCRRKS